MKKFVLVLVSALSLFSAQAQEKVTYVTVKAIDGEEYVTPVTDIDEITFRTTNVYTVTFDTDGGSEVAPQKVDEGKTVERPEDPTKNGFSFENWYKQRIKLNSHILKETGQASIEISWLILPECMLC